ncbi:MAG: hypothetical protein AVDCRST_MAG68-1719 [uncultured Gemmatimonadetes bacterium]|uniref:Uncharacterized protein n=1 Tax=uncultured Gemmatimonadota bacterium TaxID=203437 RepID=A0A6J4K3J9_9BACT|nr:MAG: hypothetical protein AVDCRST_MAG68-1719 [uncultured Gemmatimonadota bacterium]
MDHIVPTGPGKHKGIASRRAAVLIRGAEAFSVDSHPFLATVTQT